jgi:hypothetical protein
MAEDAPKMQGMARAHVEALRGGPRLSARCQVEVRDRQASWAAETEDLGPRGCQLLTDRPVKVGDVLTLQISSALMPTPLVVLGLVAWSRPAPVGRIGMAFTGALTSSLSPQQWFARLVASDPTARVRDARRTVELDAVLYLAPPPAGAVSLSPDEARLLEDIGAGKTLATISESTEPERLRRALFALLSRRLVTLSRAASVPPARWEAAIAAAELGHAAAEISRTGQATPSGAAPVQRRSADAQRLYERAVELLVAGNAVAAEALVRSAVDAAPDDPVLKNVLKRFLGR